MSRRGTRGVPNFLALTGWRMLLFLGAPNDWLISEIGSNSLDAVSGVQRVYTWALMFLALVGGFAGLRKERQTLLPLLIFFYILGVVSLFYFQARYRLPAMPFVIIMAAYGVSVIGRLLPLPSRPSVGGGARAIHIIRVSRELRRRRTP